MKHRAEPGGEDKDKSEVISVLKINGLMSAKVLCNYKALAWIKVYYSNHK